MSDPRNTAHDKKVKQEKEHQKPEHSAPKAVEIEINPEEEHGPTELEKSVAILSKLKEMEFHSRGNIQILAEVMLAIEDELKQKEFSESIEAVYSAQDGFQTKITALIETYSEKCESLKPAA